MSLRLRVGLLVAVAVAAAVALASGLVYYFERGDLLNQVDNSLQNRAVQLERYPWRFASGAFGGAPPSPFGAERQYMQFVFSSGRTWQPANDQQVPVPVTKQTLAVATGAQKSAFFQDLTVRGVHSRVLTIPVVFTAITASGPVTQNAAVQLVRPLDDVDRQLHRLSLILLFVSLGGIAVAGAGGALVAQAALPKVRRLTEAAEQVARTRDPSERVPTGGRDELSRLGQAFNTMLAELEEAIETQKRFVADASHELLTPVTSLQTNVEVLQRVPRLPSDKRRQLLADLLGELGEMRRLIGGLLELAHGQDRSLVSEEFRLDELVDECASRARSRFPEVAFDTELDPTTVAGRRERLERAVWNLLENAGKWSPPGSAVEVSLNGGELRVRDHGPGIPDADKPHIFERFYRATAARGMPGSGLGLAIVADVAQSHGGTVTVEDADGGGALFRLRLPVAGGRLS
jgi:two-component system sensor histidine kinase MprB